MKRLVFSVLLIICSSFFGVVARISPARANGDYSVVLDEFVSYPNDDGEEWIELLNSNQDSALDLTDWRLVVHQGPEGNYTYFYEQNLSGSVPRGGFLTFTTDNDARLPDDGACLVIFRDQTNSVYAVKYGNGTCDLGAEEQDATAVTLGQGKSIYYNQDESTWNSASSPTRGWCNPGTGDCPIVATIVSQLEAEGVSTNLGDQTDFSRISELYFQKSEDGENIGRITFLSEMNFTDSDALTWLQDLDSKLNISQGVISLDADLIKDLTDTQASLTMYNITLNNPKILVDGQEDTDGIVSGLTYNRAAQRLTFTAAHFTTFTAIEDTGSTSTTIASAPACGDWPPLTAPKLFQINTTQNSATLYFTPIADYLSYYFIAYGYEEKDWLFGTQFDSTQKIGVVSQTINDLSPNTTYYFTVRAGNGCAPGEWSNYLSAKTKGLSQTTKTTTKEQVSEGTDTEIEETIEPEPTKSYQPSEELNSNENKKLSLWQKIITFLSNLFR